MTRYFIVADPRTGLVVRRETEQPSKASTVNLQVFRVNKATWAVHPLGSVLTLAPGPTLDHWNSVVDWWQVVRATAAGIMRTANRNGDQPAKETEIG